MVIFLIPSPDLGVSGDFLPGAHHGFVRSKPSVGFDHRPDGHTAHL